MCILKKNFKNTHCLVPIRGGENNNVKCAESLLDLDWLAPMQIEVNISKEVESRT